MNARRTIVAMLIGAIATQAVAQGLPDPTRPPAIIEAGPTTSANAGTTGTAPSGLQSIIRRQGARPAALINGTYVELGGKIGEARLERIDEDCVVLGTATGRETLFLTPGVGKQIVPADFSVATRPRGKTGKAKP